MAPADDDQLSTRLGVEDPCAAIRARRCDARPVRADVDADHRTDRSVRSGMRLELEELCDRVLAHMLAGPSEDDVALLAVRARAATDG